MDRESIAERHPKLAEKANALELTVKRFAILTPTGKIWWRIADDNLYWVGTRHRCRIITERKAHRLLAIASGATKALANLEAAFS